MKKGRLGEIWGVVYKSGLSENKRFFYENLAYCASVSTHVIPKIAILDLNRLRADHCG